MQKLRSIQTLRAVAACAVVVLHSYPEPHSKIGNAEYGAFGVDLFFVISGFIMAQVAQGRSASEFLKDRLWRIYPMWWIAVLPWLFMVPRGLPFIASSLTLWPIYPGGYYVPVLKLGWTLSFELLFYSGMALALLSRSVVPITLYALMVISSLLSSIPLLHFLGNPMGLEFLMGVTIARLPRQKALAWLIPAGVAVLVLTSPLTGDVETTLTGKIALKRAIDWGIPAAMILWGALSIEELFDQKWFGLPVALGDASYSIYLFHPLIAYGFGGPWFVRVPAAIALGSAMHWLVERRILRRKTSAMKSEVGADSLCPVGVNG